MLLLRRLYVYLICAISLAVVTVGLINVAEIAVIHAWQVLTDDRLFSESGTDVRERLSLFLALVGVALPIFVIHWRLAERWSRSAGDESDRRSGIRALYFAGVLAVTLFVLTFSLISFLETGLSRLFGEGVAVTGQDSIQFVVTVFVVGLIWAGHAWMRHRDTSLVEMTSTAIWPVRFYLYAALFVGAMFVVTGVAEVLVDIVTDVARGGTRVLTSEWLDQTFTFPISRVVVGGLIWGTHWTYSRVLLGDTGWRGESERASRLRLVFLFLLLLIGMATTIISSGVSLGEAIRAVVDSDAVQQPVSAQILSPLAFALPFAVLWWFHRSRLRYESHTFAGESGLSSVNRTHRYMLSLLGLALGAIGAGYFAGILVEFIFDMLGLLDTSPDWNFGDASQLLAFVLIGAAVWTPGWIAAQRAAAQSPDTERVASSRRAYLYLVLTLSTLALLVALATMLYEVFQVLLDVRSADGLAGDVGRLLGVTVVASVLLGYHVRTLLIDQDYRKPEVEQVPLTLAEEELVSLELTLTAPDRNALERAFAELSRHVPPGSTLREKDEELISASEPTEASDRIEVQADAEMSAIDDEPPEESQKARIFS